MSSARCFLPLMFIIGTNTSYLTLSLQPHTRQNTTSLAQTCYRPPNPRPIIKTKRIKRRDLYQIAPTSLRVFAWQIEAIRLCLYLQQQRLPRSAYIRGHTSHNKRYMKTKTVFLDYFFPAVVSPCNHVDYHLTIKLLAIKSSSIVDPRPDACMQCVD